MVPIRRYMVYHSPSPNSRRPIQQWEVKEIADEVESWYEKGAPPPQKKPTVPPQQPRQEITPPSPEALEEKNHTTPIQESEASSIVEAAEQFITQGDESKSSSENLEDKIRALRIEEEILKYAPQVADELRLDTKPHWIASPGYRLLPYDAPDQMQRRHAVLVFENLQYRLGKAQENGTPFTKDDVINYFNSRQHGDTDDFTLDNLYAVAQREMLVYYKLRDDNERVAELYDDTAKLHGLIQEAAGRTPDGQLITSVETEINMPPIASIGGDVPNVGS